LSSKVRMSKGNMNKAKQSIFTPQNDAPQHTTNKANDIRFQKSSLASTDKNENNFFPGKGLHLFIGSANMLFIGLLLVVQAKPKLIRDDVHIIWC